ncbi:MAG: hypothetical protein HC799_06745 [Limnothrix sp. RL_2_0]|nr:hypothetical protein [Limnothrix sp. RL_2_0]
MPQTLLPTSHRPIHEPLHNNPTPNSLIFTQKHHPTAHPFPTKKPYKVNKNYTLRNENAQNE